MEKDAVIQRLEDGLRTLDDLLRGLPPGDESDSIRGIIFDLQEVAHAWQESRPQVVRALGKQG